MSWCHKSIILVLKKIQEKISWSEDSPFLLQDTRLKQCRHDPISSTRPESQETVLCLLLSCTTRLDQVPRLLSTDDFLEKMKDWRLRQGNCYIAEPILLLILISKYCTFFFFHSDHFVDPEVKCSHTQKIMLLPTVLTKTDVI